MREVRGAQKAEEVGAEVRVREEGLVQFLVDIESRRGSPPQRHWALQVGPASGI